MTDTLQVIQSDLNQPITLEWYHKTYAYLPLKPQDAVMQADTPEKVLRYGLRKPRIHKRQSKSSPCSPWNTGLPTSVAADSATISMRTSPNFFSGGTGCHEWVRTSFPVSPQWNCLVAGKLEDCILQGCVGGLHLPNRALRCVNIQSTAISMFITTIIITMIIITMIIITMIIITTIIITMIIITMISITRILGVCVGACVLDGMGHWVQQALASKG
jgi:hypothetical protein